MATNKGTTSLQTPNTITRRQILVFGLSTAVGGLSLVGCGGSSGGGSGSGAAGTTRISGTVVLPPGLPPTGLTFVSGFEESALTGSKVKARVLTGSPTLVSVIDPNSGRVALIGMVDPTGGSFTLDAQNMAATLLFLAFGASQSDDADRQDLWDLFRGSTPTTTLAGVLSARLAIDPFALENGDTVLLAAIQTAIDDSRARTLKRTIPAKSTKRIKARGELIRPTPAVDLDISNQNAPIPTGQISLAALGNDLLPDCVSVVSINPLSFALYAYHTTVAGGLPTSAKSIFGPARIPQSRETIRTTEPIPVGLENPDDSFEFVHFVALTPLFNAPEPELFSDSVFANEVAGWRLELAEQRQGILVNMAANIAFEAVGLARSNDSVSGTAIALNSLRALGNLQGVFDDAGIGIHFAQGIDGLTDFASASEANAQAFLDALKPLAPAETPVTASRLVELRGLLRISNIAGLATAAAQYGRIAATVIYSDPANPGPTVAITGPFHLSKVVPTLTPSTPTYSPGGADVTATLSVFPTDYIEHVGKLVYHWKLFGAGTSKILDGAGKTGTEFDSDKTSVKFRAGTNATGLQTVGVEIFSTAGGGRFSVGKTTIGLQPAADNHLKLSPAEAHIVPAGTGGWTVTYDGNPDVTGWPGIDSNHLKFKWELASSTFGKLGVSSATSTSIETTANHIQFFANVSAQDGVTESMQVTVSLVDPNTGEFTNLAVLSGTVKIDVKNNCVFRIVDASFPLTDLNNPAEYRVLQSGPATFSSDEGGPYFATAYRPNGANTDYFGAVLRNGGSAIQDGAVATLSQNGPGTVSAITLKGAITKQPFNSDTLTGDAAVLQVVKNGAGAVTYAKFSGSFTATQNDGRSIRVEYTAGMGFPPS